MSYDSFVKVMERLGVSNGRCRHDKDAGLYICKAGELRITGNSISNKLTVTNMRTRARFMANANEVCR